MSVSRSDAPKATATPRSPVAKALRSPHLKQKIVPSKTTYTRKTKHPSLQPGDNP